MTSPPPTVFAPVLAKLGVDAAAYFGLPSVRLAPVEYQQREFSHLLRLAVYRGESADLVSNLFLKLTKAKAIDGGLDAQQQRVAHDYDITCRVYSSMLRYPDVGVVPPIACYPEHLAIVTEQVTGWTLLQHLRQAAWFPGSHQMADLCDTMATVGRWIRVFQSTFPPEGRVSIESLGTYVDHRLKKLAAIHPSRFRPEHRQGIQKHIEQLGAVVPLSELVGVPVHSDFALGNILVSGQRIVVLDFAMTKTGCAFHDLARLFVQLELLAVKPHVRASVVRRLQTALLGGFDPAMTPDRPLFRLLLLLHSVNHLTGLTLAGAPFPESVYNGLVCRRHRRCIREELERIPAAVEHA